MDIWHGGMFLHVFVSEDQKFKFSQPSLLGSKGLVGVCDPYLFTCRVNRSDLGAIFGDVPHGVLLRRVPSACLALHPEILSNKYLRILYAQNKQLLG